MTLRTGLGLHRRRWQDILGRQATEGQIPAMSKSLHPFLRRSAAGRTPRGSAPPLTTVVIYGQGAPPFPDELRWRRDALRAVLPPNPVEQTCILYQSLCLGPYRSRDVFTPVEPIGKCIHRSLEEANFNLTCERGHILVQDSCIFPQ